MTGDLVRAAVLRGPRDLAVEEFATPTAGPDEAVLTVETCGVCGSDFETFDKPTCGPVVLGHEVVGRIDSIGETAQRLFGVATGQRVVVNEVLPCGRCSLCSGGHQELCNGFFGTDGARYGNLPTTLGSGLWGGFADRMVLDPRTQLVPISDEVPSDMAALFMPLANGVNWLFTLGQLGPGGGVVVVGPGPQGLAVTAVAALQPGVRVLTVGRDSDAARLAVAAELGAVTASIESDAMPAAVKATFGPDGADVIVLATSGATSVLASATRWVRIGGRIVVAGTNGWATEERFKSDALVFRALTLVGAPGHSWRSVRSAVRLLESRPDGFAPLVGASIGLYALPGLLSRQVPAGGGLHVSVNPAG